MEEETEILNHKPTTTTLQETQWKFKDEIRTIDFVLVWDERCEESRTIESSKKREIYEANLIEAGLELEHEDVEDTGLHFVKIHAPLEVRQRFAEILKLRMPMRELHKVQKPETDTMFSCWKNWLKENIFINQEVFPEYKQRFTAIYSRDKEYLFDSSSPGFFTPAIRSRIVQFVLDRTFFKSDDGTKANNVFSFGIERLISYNVYSAAYPLHDGDLYTPGTMRYSFYHHWASIQRWYRYQPIDHIRQYFGVKIGLYFAWLGFYTHMLLPASVVGLACFLISLCLLSYDQPTEDICSGDLNAQMCPLCDYFCSYWDISETCSYTKILYLFDNYTTVFFAVFMSFWAAMFLEMWKRYSAEITHRWDLTGFDTQEEHPRPQYLVQLTRLETNHKVEYKHNVITNAVEPRVPFWKMRFPSTIFSFSVVLLLVSLAIAAVIGVTLYRMSVLAALSVYGDSVITSYAIIITTTTAATINLVCIFVFNWMYTYLAEYLTELEMLRTQTEFDNSLTLKMYLLQFVNYYASIFYIAFCKGKLVGFPAKYNRLFGYRQEECGPGGCLLELSIQLAIIMVGKQAFNSCLEMVYPIVWKWWNSRHLKQRSAKGRASQWEKDYKLVEWGSQALFPEYLEMVLQYGFVTIFVSAFPLAPLFALLNNILESRLDAKKLVTYHRRPVAQRVRDIGVWFNILDSVSKLAVITNGFIIAFTSDFVPRLLYKMSSPDHSLTGYMNHSLAYVDVRDLDMQGKPNSSLQYCRFSDYREPPWSPHKYEKTTMYWHVLAARLAFVVLFENLVVVLVLVVQWLIPDIPAKLSEQIRREAYLTNEIIISQEAQRVCKRSRSTTNSLESVEPTFTNKSPDILPNKHQSKFTREEIQDAAMIHRPQSFGEICEECV
ncbi:anoctamin-1 isoform X2 [Macrosteles quadrilineatus]|uniref:anoctamin-1 isoform X2 n=1 Tax=Macrosteles quadrilineatus TaxID=74068 RepID=UPI0023E09A12|nr:anoctamin-1 isoform X2 [Macrosteles quadrilineatus]